MKEQLISLKTAKLAKENGFDIPTPWYYHPRYGLHTAFWDEGSNDNSNHNSNEWTKGYYSAPTQSLLQKWLREKHKIVIAVLPWKDHGDDVNEPIRYRPMIHRVKTYGEYPTYEEALEEGLYQTLLLIKS